MVINRPSHAAADNTSRSAEFRLLDGQGATLAQKHTDFSAFTVGQLQGLFDLRNFLRHCVEENQQVQALAEIGVCIAEEVLGTDIFGPPGGSRNRSVSPSRRLFAPAGVPERLPFGRHRACARLERLHRCGAGPRTRRSHPDRRHRA